MNLALREGPHGSPLAFLVRLEFDDKGLPSIRAVNATTEAQSLAKISTQWTYL